MSGNPRVYAGFRWTRGDLDNAALGIMLPTINRSLHIASFGDEATDWNVAAPANPTVYLHSETTPATDYVSMAHDADNLTIRVFGGGMILTPVTDVMFSDATGIIVGGTTQVLVEALTPEVQIQGTAEADSSLFLSQYSAAALQPSIFFGKSRGATIGSFTIITSGDMLGRIGAYGADGVDFNSNGQASAEIRFFSSGTVAADRMPGELRFLTATDAAPSVLTNRVTITNAGLVDMLFTARVGLAGTRTGTLGISGATSGTVTVTVGAAAGTWTMQLPAAVGAAGQQLTDAAGDGICTWAAASLGAWKNDLGVLDPHEALEAVLSAPTHKFTYNAAVMPAGQWAPPDKMVGVFAEEAPWAMHGERADGNGIAFSNINSFGYARAAIQALYEDLQGALAEIVGLKSRLAALNT